MQSSGSFEPTPANVSLMRILLSCFGVIAIIAYGVFGAMLMSNWAIAAATEVPLATAIADMEAAHQPYSTTPGIIFAVLGTLLALGWGILMLIRNSPFSDWAGASLWAVVIMLGAPAYFFASFSNLMSVGDTYYEWNSGAAFALEAPLYMASGISFVFLVGSFIVVMIKSTVRRQRPP